MENEIENENTAEKAEIECPICEQRFRDKRGLTSHARHFHEMGKEEIEKARIKKAEKEDSTGWKIAGGVGAVLLAILTAGRFR